MPTPHHRLRPDLLARLDARLRRGPRAFGRRFLLASAALWSGIALLLAALGGGTLALNLAAWRAPGWTARIAATLLLLAALVLIRAVIGAFAARLDPPEGIKLRVAHAPALF